LFLKIIFLLLLFCCYSKSKQYKYIYFVIIEAIFDTRTLSSRKSPKDWKTLLTFLRLIHLVVSKCIIFFFSYFQKDIKGRCNQNSTKYNFFFRELIYSWFNLNSLAFLTFEVNNARPSAQIWVQPFHHTIVITNLKMKNSAIFVNKCSLKILDTVHGGKITIGPPWSKHRVDFLTQRLSLSGWFANFSSYDQLTTLKISSLTL